MKQEFLCTKHDNSLKRSKFIRSFNVEILSFYVVNNCYIDYVTTSDNHFMTSLADNFDGIRSKYIKHSLRFVLSTYSNKQKVNSHVWFLTAEEKS